jgi:hypothetical protein
MDSTQYGTGDKDEGGGPGSGRVRRQEIGGIKEEKGRIAADAEGEQDKEAAAEQRDTLSSQLVLNQLQ